MNSRLQQFLELENLTPARLADILGIQRSGLSHILSGRNKPGYDFIFKLLTKFPSVNAEWILIGKGKPYRELAPQPALSDPQSGNGTPHQQNASLVHQPLSDQPILGKSDKYSDLKNDWDTNTLFSPINTPVTESDRLNYDISNQGISGKNTPSQMPENEINANKSGTVGKERSIKRIIVFYSDGSFEELFPHK